jgi:hypothetical protein
MTLPIKDGNGADTAVATVEAAGVHTPKHIVVSSTGVSAMMDDEGRASVITQNITTKFRDAFEAWPSTNWTEVKGSGDIIQIDGNAAAASYLVISKDPHNAGSESSITSDLTFTLPVEMAFGASMSQRTLGQEFAVEIVDTGTPLPDVADIAISSITQTTTTITVNTVAAHNLVVGKSIGIRDCVDARANYPSLVVASTPSPTQFTATASPNGTIASQSLYIAPVVAATTAALPTATYANGTAGVGATLTATANGAFPAQDGITLVLNDRVLVKNQAAAAENGIYTLTTVGTAGTPWVLTRAADFDTAGEMLINSYVSVLQGTTQATHRFALSATVTTVGTTAVTFTALGAGSANNLGFVYFRERLGRAQNGISQIFENVTATNASLYLRSEAGDVLPSGTILGNHAITVGTTAPIALASAPYMYTWSPTTEYRIVGQADRVQWSDAPVDTLTQAVNRGLRTQVCPDPSVTYKLRIRATNNKALTVPNAQVVSVVKSGTTTGTFTTDVAHNYTTGDLVVYYGSNDNIAANFPNLTAATAITVTGANTFTAVIGTGTTGTGFGGYVAKVQGGNLMSALGATAITAINATLTTLSDGTRQLVLTGSGTWTGAAIGDYVNVVGCRTLAASLGVDGAWKVANLATTALTLVPATAAFAATLPANFGVTTCGGGVIRRTDLRLSFVRIFDFERERVELLARPGGDLAGAVPVVLQGGTTAVTGTLTGVTTVTTVSAVTSGNLGIPGIIADVASAAITTTATVAAITPTFGTSYQVNIPVTAVAGTNPTLDVTIEESDDSGTNWFKVYDFPRITATGIYRSPVIPLTGNRVRYVQTVGGTSGQSFTRAINRLQSSYPAVPVRQLIDRAINVNSGNPSTSSLVTADCGNRVQLVVSMGAITTTAPAFQIQGSDDNGASWYSIGAPLTAVASSTVQLTVSDINSALTRVTVSTTGSGATLNSLTLKAHD